MFLIDTIAAHIRSHNKCRRKQTAGDSMDGIMAFDICWAFSEHPIHLIHSFNCNHTVDIPISKLKWVINWHSHIGAKRKIGEAESITNETKPNQKKNRNECKRINTFPNHNENELFNCQFLFVLARFGRFNWV